MKPRIANSFILALLILIPVVSVCQEKEEDTWDTYMSDYEGKPGSVVLNMSLKERAPVAKFLYVLVTGVTYTKCDTSGFPVKDEFPGLYAISDSVAALINSIAANNINAGTFTHQCERLDYYYVSDTQKLRSALEALYSRSFKNYKPYINIKEDKSWEYYLSFLYPNDATLNYMGDTKVVMALMEGGDKLEKPRLVEHYIYFTNAKDRDKFVAEVKKENFKIETTSRNKKSKEFSAHISRVDKVDLNSIYPISEHLRKLAIQFNGDYDGWETVLVKD